MCWLLENTDKSVRDETKATKLNKNGEKAWRSSAERIFWFPAEQNRSIFGSPQKQ